MFWPTVCPCMDTTLLVETIEGTTVCLADTPAAGALSNVSGGSVEGLRLVAESELLTTGELVIAAGALFSRLMMAALLLELDFWDAFVCGCCCCCDCCCCCCCWAAAAAATMKGAETRDSAQLVKSKMELRVNCRRNETYSTLKPKKEPGASVGRRRAAQGHDRPTTSSPHRTITTTTTHNPHHRHAGTQPTHNAVTTHDHTVLIGKRGREFGKTTITCNSFLNQIWNKRKDDHKQAHLRRLSSSSHPPPFANTRTRRYDRPVIKSTQRSWGGCVAGVIGVAERR